MYCGKKKNSTIFVRKRARDETHLRTGAPVVKCLPPLFAVGQAVAEEWALFFRLHLGGNFEIDGDNATSSLLRNRDKAHDATATRRATVVEQHPADHPVPVHSRSRNRSLPFSSSVASFLGLGPT